MPKKKFIKVVKETETMLSTVIFLVMFNLLVIVSIWLPAILVKVVMSIFVFFTIVYWVIEYLGEREVYWVEKK